jgi:HD-GYP domain-containing protein (c-di-GMP phosphodiesterase class II)
LSVVDCFDALTSDRPYRPRLSTEEAFATIVEGRGTLYDPLVVDTFLKAYPQIAPLAIQREPNPQVLMNLSELPDKREPTPVPCIGFV